MRVLLVNPYYPISETPSPPLGIAYLAASLQQAGIEVKVLDLVVTPCDRVQLEGLLSTFSPEVVGVTSVTMNFDHAAEVIRSVKRIEPGIRTVMGGPHVTFCAPETMRSLPELDFICLGEGEETIVELAYQLDAGHCWANIKGLVYRDGDDIRFTPPRPRIPAIDHLPQPARELLPLARYRALHMPLTMTTSRGCPFACIFCVGRRMVGNKIRYRNPVKVAEELATLAGLNFHQVNIADDLFTANKAHCLAVCDEIMKLGAKVRWTCFGRVDTVTPTMLEKMRMAGCEAICFGVESANAAILKTIKKKITPEQVIGAVSMCLAAGITPHASFILGLPGESRETLRETVGFAKRLKGMGAMCGFHVLAPFPGTQVREESARLGIRILTDDWRQYHANRAIVETEKASRAMLDEIVIAWEEEFNMWLGEISRRREKGEATEEEASLLKNLERTVLLYDLMMRRTIEQQGVWEMDGQPYQDPLMTLAERAAAATGHPFQELYGALASCAQRGDLVREQLGQRIKWRWADPI